MDLNQIRSFLTVAQTLNFTGAAHRNGVPQSTISRQIDSLEEQLGAALFYRTKREVKLTEEGRAFLPYAQEMLDAASKGAAAVKQLHEGAHGRLSIATVVTSGVFLAGCLREFARRYPDIVVDITHVSSGDILLNEGVDPYDFHFLHRDMLTDSGEFEMLATHSDTLSLVLPKGHPMAGKPVDFERLQQEKFIVITEEESPILYMQIMELCKAQRFTPRIVNRFDNVKSVLLSVAAGLGVSILPSSLPQESMTELLDIVPLYDMGAEITYAVAWKKELLNPAARLFLAVIHDYLQAHPSEQFPVI